MKKEVEVVNNCITFEINELSEAGRRALTSVPYGHRVKRKIPAEVKRNLKHSKAELIKKFNIISD